MKDFLNPWLLWYKWDLNLHICFIHSIEVKILYSKFIMVCCFSKQINFSCNSAGPNSVSLIIENTTQLQQIFRRVEGEALERPILMIPLILIYQSIP